MNKHNSTKIDERTECLTLRAITAPGINRNPRGAASYSTTTGLINRANLKKKKTSRASSQTSLMGPTVRHCCRVCPDSIAAPSLVFLANTSIGTLRSSQVGSCTKVFGIGIMHRSQQHHTTLARARSAVYCCVVQQHVECIHTNGRNLCTVCKSWHSQRLNPAVCLPVYLVVPPCFSRVR